MRVDHGKRFWTTKGKDIIRLSALWQDVRHGTIDGVMETVKDEIRQGLI